MSIVSLPVCVMLAGGNSFHSLHDRIMFEKNKLVSGCGISLRVLLSLYVLYIHIYIYII